ncbi:MAG: ABC transporter ATP-binding protein [Desulfovibrionaceae bacterium]|nr:ABC transporter ATP-binding protein [Desulfovibrionaceae bacterium]
MNTLLDIHDLSIAFGACRVVRRLTLQLRHGRTFCLVGESGSGKSMTALSILRLVPHPGRIVSGTLLYEGNDLLSLDESAMCRLRGRSIAMIFQEPMTSLNPVLRIGDQVAEPLRIHLGQSRQESLDHAHKLLNQVGIPSAAARLRDYPHQLSGGMRQRVMIAMALACSPSLLLADEPTTALDVTIQGQILRLLKTLAEEKNMGLLLITHDLGVVAETADDVGVMYAGELVEQASAHMFFERPLHPYAHGLMACAPTVDTRMQRRLTTISGSVPPPAHLPEGCAFRPRCPRAFERCRHIPPVVEAENGHLVRCWLYA